MPFRGYFYASIYPRVTGFNKQGGDFWIGFLNDDDTTNGQIRIELTVPAEESPSSNTYAILHVHHDGVNVLRKLLEIGFLDIFEEIQASTFYDVVQCCERCNIPIQYNGEYTKEMTSRRMYELLYLGSS
jgi:hypothetical protein